MIDRKIFLSLIDAVANYCQ